MEQGTAVARAIRVVGGVTRASVICKVANQTVYLWLRRGKVPSSASALRLAHAVQRQGVQITAYDLAGIAEPDPEPNAA